MKRFALCVCVLALLTACAKKEPRPITIAINPWPGYELLYLAEKKQFFEKVGANIKLYQLGSLSDAQRAYLNGQVDGLTSTLIEAVQAQVLGGQALKIIMVPDYSNGGDVIVSNKSASSISDLKGKTIGCEVSSLGIYILQRALVKSGLTLDDVKVVNVEQSDGLSSLNSGAIDAFVTYPPMSVDILANENYQQIFSSADIPREIIDIVSISDQALQDNPQLVKKIHRAWDMAREYFLENPEEASAIMAEREGIPAEDFLAVINEEIVIMSSVEQRALLASGGGLQERAVEVCETLVKIGALETQCDSLPNMIYSGEL